MIRFVRIRNFKRFGEVTFDLPDHAVLAGSSGTGKTTVLQAIASWSFALRRWRWLNDFARRRGYARAPVSRQAFTAVPLRSFDLLWKDREYRRNRTIEIELGHSDGWSATMELIADTTEQIYVRPRADVSLDVLREPDFPVVYLPPMTGVGIDEPAYMPPKVEQLLGAGRAGEALRNLLAEAGCDQAAWGALQDSVEALFGCRLCPADTTGAHIGAGYRPAESPVAGPVLDIAGAGSGFQQVVMLLAVLNARPGAVLLLDDPAAHLPVALQGVVHNEMRSTAARQRSQLVVATHSRAIVDSVEPSELRVMLDGPRTIAGDADRSHPVSPFRVLSNADALQALEVRGVIYTGGSTEAGILRAWAARLRHPAEPLLTKDVMWRPVVRHARKDCVGSDGIGAHEHFEALRRVRKGLPGIDLLDGSAQRDSDGIACAGLQRLRWRRCEIESYLLHRDSLARFVESVSDPASAAAHIEDMLAYWNDQMPPAVARDPLGDHEYLNNARARTALLPPLLEAAGVHGLPYTRYREIAEVMLPEEIHPEVREKLDAICRAFGVEA